MATLRGYQDQLTTAINAAPSYLVKEGFYVYETEGTQYNPVTDDYDGSSVTNIVIKCIRGVEEIEGETRITFLTNSLPFADNKPSVNGTLVFAQEQWNIIGIRQDPIGLTYRFVVENKDGF